MYELLNQLRNKNIRFIFQNKPQIIQTAMDWVNGNKSDQEKEELDSLMRILNIIYNCTPFEILDDGFYDLLQEKYKSLFPDNYQVGSEQIEFSDKEIRDAQIEIDKSNLFMGKDKLSPISFISMDDYDEMNDLFYKEELLEKRYKPSSNDFKKSPFHFETNISKRTHSKPLDHPDLIGTLDKCKFVLMKDAIENGVENDPNVKVLERDFFGEHIKNGIIDPNKSYQMVVELKYDGVSAEADCSNVVLNAGSRGDMDLQLASDMTPLLGGYIFPNAPAELIGEPLGIKFEAIIDYYNLWKFSQAKGKRYVNGRSAIVGLLGSSDAWKYRDFITLVPLQLQRVPGMEDNRIVEIEFLNQYFSSGEKLRYAVIEGDYGALLFQIDLFRREAEYARAYLPFMYDGIVVSYTDPEIRKQLGRKNFVNKYSMAVKFNPLEKETEFLGYSYTVGQDGRITPKIHYVPVEFNGTIHPKSSGHSYKRFKELNLRPGDIIKVKYEHDVMPYVYKEDNDHNNRNAEINDPVPFIEYCPECGTKIVISDTGKMAYCPNTNCKGRSYSRATNLLAKLNFQGFSDETVKTLGISSLSDIMNMTREKLSLIGNEVTANNYFEQLNILTTDPKWDYEMVGALGFTSVAKEKWKLIFNKISLPELISSGESGNLEEKLVHIKGIGPNTIKTIVEEFEIFRDDLILISNMKNIKSSFGLKSAKKIRFTGVRNKELVDRLSKEGYDIGEGSVTKDTDILIIPTEGFESSKTRKCGPNTIMVPIQEFISNMVKYL